MSAFVDTMSDILVRQQVITKQEAAVYKEQFEASDVDSFEYFLIDEGLISKEELLTALASQYRVPSIDVTGYFFDSELIRNFPKEFLLKNEIIPVDLDDEFLIIASAHPDNAQLPVEIEKYVSQDVQFNVGIARDIIDAVEEYYDVAVTEVPEDLSLTQEHDTYMQLPSLEDQTEED